MILVLIQASVFSQSLTVGNSQDYTLNHVGEITNNANLTLTSCNLKTTGNVNLTNNITLRDTKIDCNKFTTTNNTITFQDVSIKSKELILRGTTIDLSGVTVECDKITFEGSIINLNGTTIKSSQEIVFAQSVNTLNISDFNKFNCNKITFTANAVSQITVNKNPANSGDSQLSISYKNYHQVSRSIIVPPINNLIFQIIKE